MTHNHLQTLWDIPISFVGKEHQRKHDSLEVEGTHLNLLFHPSCPAVKREKIQTLERSNTLNKIMQLSDTEIKARIQIYCIPIIFYFYDLMNSS